MAAKVELRDQDGNVITVLLCPPGHTMVQDMLPSVPVAMVKTIVLICDSQPADPEPMLPFDVLRDASAKLEALLLDPWDDMEAWKEALQHEVERMAEAVELDPEGGK